MAVLVTSGPGTRHERESLKDTIARIDPAEAPFYTNCGSTTAGAVKHEWTVQELPAVNGANFVAEGADTTDTAGQTPVRIDNAVSISSRDGKVSGTYNRISLVAGQRETARQKILEGLALRRDAEASLTANNVKVQAGTREHGGVQNYITNIDAGTAPAGDGSNAPTLPVARALDTIDYIDAAMELAHRDGGKPRALYLDPTLKRKFSKIPDAIAGTAAASTNQVNQTATSPLTFNGAASAYLSDFGLLQVISSIHMASGTALMIDPDHIAKAFTSGGEMNQMDLAKVGDSDRFQIINEFTLEVDAPKAHAACLALT